MTSSNDIMSCPVLSCPVYSCNFLITGANFGNKGAQSMLYTSTNELLKRFPGSTIYFASTENYDEETYTFRKLYFFGRNINISLGGLSGVKAFMKAAVKDAVKFIIGRENRELKHYRNFSEVMRRITAIIDISGYSLGSKWGNNIPYGYINKIRLAKKYSIPIYLMPQSFGPFDYTPDVMQKLQPMLADILSYPRIIFAREREGFDSMQDLFGLHNVKLSADIVLQNSGLDLKNIFRTPPVISVPKINADRELAGIVPNMRCLDHGDKDRILHAYREIVDYVLGLGYRVVLFRHSREDLEFCRLIKNFYASDENVMLIENEFTCLEYNEFVRQFKFLICSRYHGLVHAYKNIVPCIALGWAVKYFSLTENVGQKD